jgi:hypothetical protein
MMRDEQDEIPTAELCGRCGETLTTVLLKDRHMEWHAQGEPELLGAPLERDTPLPLGLPL